MALSAIQMAGSTKFGFHCVLGVFFTPVVRFFSITTWVSLNFLQFPSLRSALHSLSVYLALTSLTSCPLFLSHVSYKKNCSQFLSAVLLHPLLHDCYHLFQFLLTHSLLSVVLWTSFFCGLAFHIYFPSLFLSPSFA